MNKRKMWIKGIIIHPEVLLNCSEEEFSEFEKFLKKYNLKLFGFSTHENKKYEKMVTYLGGELLTELDIGKKKGSKEWIEYIENNFHIPHNKLIYIGFGNKKFDWITAINSSVFYIHYSKFGIHYEIKKYVLSISDLIKITEFIEIFFASSPLFTYKKDFDSQIRLRILFDAGVNLYDYQDIKFSLQDLFTYNKTFYFGKIHKIDARSVLFLVLIIQLWKEELASRGVVWCVYPSSKKGKISQNIEPYLRFFRGLTGAYYNDVLERIENTLDKSDARRKREHYKISFAKERDTLRINENLKLKNKNVIVVDDFSTSGMSLEIAKNLILDEEANTVTLCAVGKYGSSHKCYDLDGKKLDEVVLKINSSAQNKLIELIRKFNELF